MSAANFGSIKNRKAPADCRVRGRVAVVPIHCGLQHYAIGWGVEKRFSDKQQFIALRVRVEQT
jgi:hypothetical protein